MGVSALRRRVQPRACTLLGLPEDEHSSPHQGAARSCTPRCRSTNPSVRWSAARPPSSATPPAGMTLSVRSVQSARGVPRGVPHCPARDTCSIFTPSFTNFIKIAHRDGRAVNLSSVYSRPSRPAASVRQHTAPGGAGWPRPLNRRHGLSSLGRRRGVANRGRPQPPLRIAAPKTGRSALPVKAFSDLAIGEMPTKLRRSARRAV